ncbi:MAG: hypothetical protein E7553_04155 [Ruminococcaceae bacterium]|nr:hypothetical protein [Oscillospiraceae bacterium]
MKLFKKAFAVVLCIAMIACSAAVMSVSAEEVGAPTGLRWFPVPAERQNDDAWEVECIANGCLCQRFTETAEDTGNTNFLLTEYTADGGLKLTRNPEATIILGETDYSQSNYWPRIRTLSLETSPEIDLATYNTLYFDVVVEEGTNWNLSVAFNGMNIGLGKTLAETCGNTYDAGSLDAASGTYKGSINIMDTINAIAADTSHLDTVNAQALKNMKKFFVPQLQVYVVGGLDASLTINSLYLSTPDDATGENCGFVDMGLLSGLGDEYYEMMEDEGGNDEPVDDPDVNQPAEPDEGPEGDTPAVGEEEDDTTTTAPTKATTADKGDKDEGGSPVIFIVIGVVAVVVIAVVVIILSKKKK